MHHFHPVNILTLCFLWTFFNIIIIGMLLRRHRLSKLYTIVTRRLWHWLSFRYQWELLHRLISWFPDSDLISTLCIVGKRGKILKGYTWLTTEQEAAFDTSCTSGTLQRVDMSRVTYVNELVSVTCPQRIFNITSPCKTIFPKLSHIRILWINIL
jgi:hypothetical protein